MEGHDHFFLEESGHVKEGYNSKTSKETQV